MLCQFERLIYPQSVRAIDAGSFMIAVYRPCEKIKDSAGDLVTQVKAVGYGLPIADKQRYELQGHWSKNPKHGVQFEVETYDEVITPTREGIIAYLSSGQIKGIGPKMAEKIFDAFGLTALEVLDKEPERLLTISGISSNKLKKICDSYMANRGARDVVAFLSPHGITPNRAVKLYAQIVMIGDSDQLPSVGPGAVLSEMIASARIPVVRLDRVFRQTDGSRIAVNAKLIRHGNLSLEYGSDFRFVDSATMSDSANRIAELYMQEVAKYGVDNVASKMCARQLGFAHEMCKTD